MKTSREVSSEKLRGGFYTPVPLVVRCLERVEALSWGQRGITLLEPSAGDGAFIRGLAQSRDFAAAVGKVVAIEPEPHEAGLCAAALADHALDGHVLVDSAVVWSAATDEQFDCAVGNPPYVRFQFVTASDRAGVASLEQRIGLSFSGVSNLWIPVLIGSLTRLRIGGSFAFVIPTECFTGISAGVLRTWLVANTIDLRFDLFPPGSFPGVLQEVTILSGRRSEPSEAAISCEIREYDRAGSSHTATHQIPFDPQPWTRYLLTKTQLGAFEEAFTQLTCALGHDNRALPCGGSDKTQTTTHLDTNGLCRHNDLQYAVAEGHTPQTYHTTPAPETSFSWAGCWMLGMNAHA